MRIDLPDPDLFHQMMEVEIKKDVDAVITGIVTDSFEAMPGDLFLALKGEKTDGHRYLAHAKNKGCTAALVTHRDSTVDLPQISVDNVTETISILSKVWRTNFKTPILAITGSNGKTTTKDLLVHIISSTGPIHGTRGNYNTRLGLPLTLLELSHHHTLSILEMGANTMGDIGYLCDIAQPHYGLITNIAPAHLQYFGTIENVIKTKGELFKCLPKNGIAFINAEDEHVKSLWTEAQTITYGFSHKCDFSSDIYHPKNEPLSLIINGYEINLNSYNETFAINVVAACTVAASFDVSWETIQKQVPTFEPTSGRCRVKHFEDITIIDDTYNANPQSTSAAINLLFSLPANGKRIVVFGDMLELGKDSEIYHQEVGKQCVQSGVDALFCYGSDSISTVNAAKDKILATHYTDKDALVSDLKSIIKSGDVVLVKGSRGVEMETIIEEVFKV